MGFLFKGFFMWLCGSDFFLSVVMPAQVSGNLLLVRGRREGDIESLFPKAKVNKTIGRDYLFRAFISRSEVAAVIASQIEKIDYDNFKNSVRDNQLHDAYMKMWQAMSDVQVIAPYTLVKRSK